MSLPDPDDLGRLGDVVIYGNRALRHLGSLSMEEFALDEKTIDSVVRCLAVVGEAAWKLSKPLQQAHPAVPWHLIAGMRHRLVHDYGGVHYPTVYRVVTHDLPALIAQAESMIAEAGPPC
jgi:uncharacterized protein with HEPN domain